MCVKSRYLRDNMGSTSKGLVVFFAIAVMVFAFHHRNKEKDMANTLIPREVLFGNPDKMSVKLSSDGDYISYIAPKD